MRVLPERKSFLELSHACDNEESSSQEPHSCLLHSPRTYLASQFSRLTGYDRKKVKK